MYRELYPKFIVEKIDNKLCLIIGKCVYHRELARDVKNVIGGGWWERYIISNKIIFYGSSDQFGKVEDKDIIFCVQHGQVYNDRRLKSGFAEDFDFTLKHLSEDIPKTFQTKLTDTELFYAIKNRFKDVKDDENLGKAIETINKHL